MGLQSYDVAARERLTAFVAAEQEQRWLTRETVTVKGGEGAAREIKIGTIVGMALFGALVITPAGGNAGDGVLGGVTLGADAQVGDYQLVCVDAALNGGRFSVTAPDGTRLADATVAVAYATPHLSLTLADGAADFVAGDTITVTVPAGDKKVVALDFAATDGTQIPYGLLLKTETAADGADTQSVAVKAFAQFVSNKIIWPVGATVDQIAVATAQLAKSHIMMVEAY